MHLLGTLRITDQAHGDVEAAPVLEVLQSAHSMIMARILHGGDPDSEVHMGPSQVAFLAAELTLACGVTPPAELEAIRRVTTAQSAVAADQPPVTDPRDALLRRAAALLSDGEVGPAADNDRLRLAVDIMRHLLGGEGR